MSARPRIVTAGIIVIGDEVLSGRTRDTNSGTIAAALTAAGIDLKEIRVVADDEPAIVEAVNTLRARYTYVFTTGGIGPTHDDITADAVARAFEVSIDIDPRARAMLEERYQPGELNEARLRMARIPAGADLIANPVSKAPGFRIGNVHVMAGVPSVMQVMLTEILPTLSGGQRLTSVTIDAGLKEGDIATAFGAIQKRHPEVAMGSYPYITEAGFFTKLVLRARDETRLAAAEVEVRAMVIETQAAMKAAAPTTGTRKGD